MNEPIKLLEKIVYDKTNRKRLIQEFQEKVWNEEFDVHERIENILIELAYDMDFYEPNEVLRTEDKSYYDDTRLENEIKSALEHLK